MNKSRILLVLKRMKLQPAALAAIAGAAIMILVLMTEPLIGMADNGDFYRTINGQGIYKLDRYEDDQYLSYFSSKYGVYEYYNDWEKSLFSSQNLYIRAALFLNGLFCADSSVFDIRWLSVLLLLELALGIYLLTDYISYGKKRLQGILLGAVCVLMFADTAYTAYFNSFYGEGIVFVSTLLLTACALLLIQGRYPPLPLLLSVVGNSAVLILCKQQNATEGLPLFLLCLFIAFGFPAKGRGFRRMAVLGASVLAVCGILMYVIIPEGFVRINQYHAMTRGALTTGENPEETLKGFGIDRQYSVLDGSIYYERYPAADVESGQLVDRFYSHYNFVSLSVYYLTHPGELTAMLDKAAGSGYSIRPAVLGNYERSADREPGAQTQFFTLYSRLKAEYMPKTVGFVAIWILLACGVCFRDRQKLGVILCLFLMGIIQIGTSIVGAGDADLSKHIFQYNVSFDLISFLCFAPPLTGFLIRLMEGFGKKISVFFPGRKRTALLLLPPLCVAVCGIPIKAQAQGERQRVCIAAPQGGQGEALADLAQACGLEAVLLPEYPEEGEETQRAAGEESAENRFEGADYLITTSPGVLEEAGEAGLRAVCIGPDFPEQTGAGVERFRNKTVGFAYGGYTGEKVFLEEFCVIRDIPGEKTGTVSIGDDREAPFAVLSEDGNYYIPCFAFGDQGANILLGAVLEKLTGREEAGKTYFVLDEVYVFSDLNKVCGWAEQLHDSGIPFLVRVMPLYDNLDYPAFRRFTQALRYMQSMGGTVILHDPIVAPEQTEREPLPDKMQRFRQALAEEAVQEKKLQAKPLFLQPEELEEITVQSKNFGRLPFDMMTGVTPEMTDEEFTSCLDRLNKKWLSFDDLSREYGDSLYLYQEREIPEDYAFRGEREAAAFSGFFSTGNRLLIAVVGVSLVVLCIFLAVGRKWYRRKFYR